MSGRQHHTQFELGLKSPLYLTFVEYLLTALLVCTVLHAPTAAQQNVFTILGRVSLPNGRPASRVTVKIEGLSGLNREVFSDDQGAYEFGGIPGGRYRMTVKNPNEPTQYTDPVEADTSRSAAFRLVVHLFLRTAPENVKSSRKPGVLSVAEAMQNVPEKARKAYEQGLKFKNNNKLDQALASFNQAIQLFPEYFQALSERGDVHIARNEVDDAIEDFERALKHNDKFHPALRGAGYSRLERQKFGEAAHYLVRALEAEPNDAKSHLFLGIALLGMNEGALAKQALQQALKLDAEGAITAHVYMADVYARDHQYREAAQELQIFLKARPAAPNAARLKAMEASLRSRATAAPRK